MENVLKKNGFESEDELQRLISNLDLMSDKNIQAFKKWQHEDGSKAGLLKLQTVPDYKII